MKKKIIGIFICMLLIGTVLPASGTLIIDTTNSSNISGNTLYVGGSGEGNYTKIQDAIDNASIGDTVFVYDDSSPYYEHVVVTKLILLLGENKNTTVIDGKGTGYVVHINKNEVTLSGFTIKGSGSWGSHYGGLYIRSDLNLIQENIFVNNGNGIILERSTNNTISNNQFYNNEVGITIDEHCMGHIIHKNDIHDNSYIGIAIENIVSPPWFNNEITFNNIHDNDVMGIWLEDAYANIIYKNQIMNNMRGIEISANVEELEIQCNNFIGNDLDAFFRHSIEDYGHVIKDIFNRWNRNYWNGPRLFPKIIYGELLVGILSGNPRFITWINIDIRPANSPYTIL